MTARPRMLLCRQQWRCDTIVACGELRFAAVAVAIVAPGLRCRRALFRRSGVWSPVWVCDFCPITGVHKQRRRLSIIRRDEVAPVRRGPESAGAREPTRSSVHNDRRGAEVRPAAPLFRRAISYRLRPRGNSAQQKKKEKFCHGRYLLIRARDAHGIDARSHQEFIVVGCSEVRCLLAGTKPKIRQENASAASSRQSRRMGGNYRSCVLRIPRDTPAQE